MLHHPPQAICGLSRSLLRKFSLGNEFRLLLYDSGVPLPLETVLGALAMGLTASIQLAGPGRLESLLRCPRLS